MDDESEAIARWCKVKQKQKKLSRFDQIMKIKVEKPKVCSNLKNYKPTKKIKEISEVETSNLQEKLRW